MRLAGHQPTFLPWLGFFAKMAHCDVFVLADDCQMVKDDYITRARISQKDAFWIGCPVTRWHVGDPISSIRFQEDGRWRDRLLKSIRSAYGKAPHFEEQIGWLEVLLRLDMSGPAELNYRLIRFVQSYLGIRCSLWRASRQELEGARGTERIMKLVARFCCDEYLGGAHADDYQDVRLFERNGIMRQVRAYEPMPYDRGPHPWIPGLSVLDALMWRGREARDLLVYPGETPDRVS